MRSLHHVLLVGGAGFLGRWLARALVEAGASVVSIDRDPRGRLDGLGVRSLQAELSSSDRVLRATLAEQPFDAVFHLVGTGSVPRSLEHPLGDLASNAGSTLTVLDALRDRVPRPVVVQVSSAADYGDSVRLPMDEAHPLEPVSPYGVSKLAAERYVRLYCARHGLQGLCIRPFSIFGPGQRKLVVYDLLRRIEQGEDPLVVRSRPDVARDLVYVADVARAMIALASRAPARGEAYNVSSGGATTLGELAEHMIRITGRSVKVEFTGEMRPGDPLRWEGSPRSAASLGVSCDTPLADGLRRTIDWLRDDLESRTAP